MGTISRYTASSLHTTAMFADGSCGDWSARPSSVEVGGVFPPLLSLSLSDSLSLCLSLPPSLSLSLSLSSPLSSLKLSFSFSPPPSLDRFNNSLSFLQPVVSVSIGCVCQTAFTPAMIGRGIEQWKRVSPCQLSLIKTSWKANTRKLQQKNYSFTFISVPAFGVDLSSQFRVQEQSAPPVVLKCIEAVEKRG